MTKRIVANAQTNFDMLLGNNFGGKQLCKIILDFIIYFNRKYFTI